MHGRRVAVAILAGLAGLACDDRISRTVALRFEAGAPAAESVVVGDALRIHVEHTEPLRDGAELTAWARAEGAAVRLGAVDVHEPTAFSGTALGLDWAEVEEVLLTQEDSAPAPSTPPADVQFHGPPGGPLESGIDVAALAAAAVTAHIEDRTLRLRYGALPSPGSGRFYGVWVLREAAHDEPADPDDPGHDEPSEPGEPGHDEPPEALFLGALTLEGEDTFVAEEILATRDEVVVTVELERGAEAPALASVVLRGGVATAVSAPEGEAEEPPDAH